MSACELPYGRQDQDVGREEATIIKGQYEKLLKSSGCKCYYCLTELTVANVSLNRINNAKPHTYHNYVMACRR